MVNGVTGYNYGPNMTGALRTTTSAVALHKSDVENMVKFLNGQPITTTPDPTIGETVKGTIPMLAIFGGIQAGAAVKKHGWSIADTIADVKAQSPYTTRSQAVEAGKAEVIKKFKDIGKKTVAVDPHRGFIGKCLDKIPGYKSLRASGFGQVMGNKGTGAGWMAVIDGAIETMTQVVPTFQQAGAGAGFKQIAKSGTKVVAGAAGWVAGDAAGRAAGAAIGTLICPGVGTAIGSFVGGFLGGIVGSAIAGKAAKAVTGPSELEKIQNKQIEEVAAQVNDKVALAQETYKQAEEILAQDPQNKEALAAKATAEKVIMEAQAAELAQAQSQAQAPVQETQQQTAQAAFNTIPAAIPPVPGFNGSSYDMKQYQQFAVNASATNPFAQQTLAARKAV